MPAEKTEIIEEKVEEKVEEKIEERNYFHEVDWRVFTDEETEKLKVLAEVGDWQNMGEVIRYMRPDQEYQLQILIDIIRPTPVELGVDSEVKKELEESEAKGETIKSPKDEKKWQEKIDAEKESKKQQRQTRRYKK